MADSVFRRLATAIGKRDLATDPGLPAAVARSANEDALDAAVTGWTQSRDLADLEAPGGAGVPASRI